MLRQRSRGDEEHEFLLGEICISSYRGSPRVFNRVKIGGGVGYQGGYELLLSKGNACRCM